MTDKTDLLPCPFCGGEKIVDVYIRDGREMRCTSCGGSVRAFQPDASAQARLKWNTRNVDAFVEQACEVTEVVRKRAEYGYLIDSAYDKGLYQAAVEIQQAIKDKFK